MNSIGVLQLTDTLSIGGLERVAVNLANSLPREHYRSHLCATRAEGPLKGLIEPHVRVLSLRRTGRFDFGAIGRLVAYMRANRIRVLHAHGTSLFLAAAAGCFRPGTAILWHDHFGRYQTENRPVWPYRLAASRLCGVIAVNAALARWSKERLRVHPDRVWYVPNFVCPPQKHPEPIDLPGTPGKRLVCLANLRPEKDHANLLRAMKIVAANVPQAHLLAVGGGTDEAYAARLRAMAAEENLGANVSWLGPCNDVGSILAACDIGVLSSASEGLPLALIEYGMAGLAAVATQTGQCAEVLDRGRAGLLVPTSDSMQLAQAILSLLRSEERRQELARRFSRRVRRLYSAQTIMKRICGIYEMALSDLTETKRP